MNIPRIPPAINGNGLPDPLRTTTPFLSDPKALKALQDHVMKRIETALREHAGLPVVV